MTKNFWIAYIWNKAVMTQAQIPIITMENAAYRFHQFVKKMHYIICISINLLNCSYKKDYHSNWIVFKMGYITKLIA